MTTVRFVCLFCFSMLSCKYILSGIKAKGRSWYSTKRVPFSFQTTPGSRLWSLTHHGVSAGKPSRFNTGRTALQSGDRPMLIKPPRCHLFPSEEKESWIKKINLITSRLCMVCSANYLSRQDHRSWQSLQPKNSSIWRDRELQGRHARQAIVLTCAPKGTSLQPQTQNVIGQHGEGDEGGSKVWRSFPASKDLCTPGLLSLEKT